MNLTREELLTVVDRAVEATKLSQDDRSLKDVVLAMHTNLEDWALRCYYCSETENVAIWKTKNRDNLGRLTARTACDNHKHALEKFHDEIIQDEFSLAVSKILGPRGMAVDFEATLNDDRRQDSK